MIGKLVLVKYVLRILGNYNTGGKERENGNKKKIYKYIYRDFIRHPRREKRESGAPPDNDLSDPLHDPPTASSSLQSRAMQLLPDPTSGCQSQRKADA